MAPVSPANNGSGSDAKMMWVPIQSRQGLNQYDVTVFISISLTMKAAPTCYIDVDGVRLSSDGIQYESTLSDKNANCFTAVPSGSRWAVSTIHNPNHQGTKALMLVPIR